MMQATPKTHVPNEPVEKTRGEGLNMLKDKLLNLTPRHKCAVGQIITKMDKDTKEAFIQVMKGEVGDKTIADTLTEEGMSISREAIRNRRRCFRSEAGAEACECQKEGKF
jgi:hypothetical protein